MTNTEYATIEQLKTKAGQVELAGVNFLDASGEIAAIPSVAHEAVFTFIDDEKLTINRDTFLSAAFDDLQFKLRPAKPNA